MMSTFYNGVDYKMYMRYLCWLLLHIYFDYIKIQI